jgi:methionyl-tRNA formyltransferase
MRILCCINRDIASNFALNLLLPALAQHEVQVALTEQVGTVSAGEPAQRRELRIAEQGLFNEIFFPLVESRAAAAAGAALTFAEIEALKRIPFQVVQNPNTGIGLRKIRDYAPDLIVCIRYGAILQRSVIEIPRLGVLNLHSGILPTYRGMLATFRALANEDAEIGCTLHYVADATIDSGDIISVSRVPVVAGNSLLRHILDLYPSGTRMLADALRALSAGEQLPRLPQSRVAGKYYSAPTQAEWDEFCSRGWQVAKPSDVASIMTHYLSARPDSEPGRT